METLSLLRFIGLQQSNAASAGATLQGQPVIATQPGVTTFANNSEIISPGVQYSAVATNQQILVNGVPMSLSQLLQQQHQQQQQQHVAPTSQTTFPQSQSHQQQQQLLQQLQNNMGPHSVLGHGQTGLLSCQSTIAGVKRPYRDICSPSSAVTSTSGPAVILSAPQSYSAHSDSTNPYHSYIQQFQQQQLISSQNGQLTLNNIQGLLKQADYGMLQTASQLAPVANGSSSNSSMASCSPNQNSQTMNGDSDAKKVRLDGSVSPPLSATASTSSSPSKVLHFRNVPSEASESEVIYLGLPFGVPSNVLLNKKGHQAFLEMPDEDAARKCVDFYATNPKQALIRGQPVFIQFSNHRELRTDNNPAGQAALRATQAIKSGSTEDSAKCVLRVIIENYVYPVSIEILRSIFSKYGPVLKIVIFTKNNTFQALIQMGDPISALTGKMFLDGQNVFSGCDTLRIDFSKLQMLNIRFNNEKSMDYTNPNLPSGDQATSPATSGSTPAATSSSVDQQFAINVAAAAAAANTAQYTNAVNQATNAAIASLPASFFAAGAPLTAALSSTGQASSLSSTMPSTISMTAAPQNTAIPLSALSPGLNMNAVNMSAVNQALMNQAAASQNAAFAAAFGTNPAAVALPLQLAALAALNSVVHVSNLNEEKVTPDALFTLFGVYGNVIRVKILFNKRDTALVQYSDAQAAQLAINYLNGVSVYGRPMHIVLSKNLNVQLPKEGQPDAGLTRDYTDSPLHRYKKPGSKNFNNIFPPSPVLHLSNIPPGITEEFLRQLFIDRGLQLASFRFFPRDQKMALAQLTNVDDSVTALMELHNHPLNESHHLRVSFSKAQAGNPAGIPTLNCASVTGGNVVASANGRAASTPSGSSAPPSPAAANGQQLLLYGSQLQV